MSEVQLPHIVMVHQSLGLGAVDYVQKTCPEAERDLVVQMTDVFQIFLPMTSGQDLHKGSLE